MRDNPIAARSLRGRSKLSQRFPWYDRQPTLHLLVYPTADGIKLSLTFKERNGLGQLATNVLLEAVWAPREVTQEKIVSWAERALSAYIAQQVETGHEPR